MFTSMVSASLDHELKAQLDALSVRTGQSVSFHIREALALYLDDLERAYSVAMAAEDVRRGTVDTRPLEELMTDLGITQNDLEAMPGTLD